MLTNLQIEEFDKKGVLQIKNFIPIDIVSDCYHSLMGFTEYAMPINSGHLIMDSSNDEQSIKYFQYINLYIKQFNKLMSSRILVAVKQILKQEVYFSPMGLHNKGPKLGTITPAHQDNFYSCLTPPDFVTAYIPLLPFSEENGGIQYAIGSHKLPVLAHNESLVNAFSSGLSRDVLDDFEIFAPVLQPGDVVFHHGNIIHFANENRTSNNRYAIALGVFGENAMIDTLMREKYEINLAKNKAARENNSNN